MLDKTTEMQRINQSLGFERKNLNPVQSKRRKLALIGLGVLAAIPTGKVIADETTSRASRPQKEFTDPTTPTSIYTVQPGDSAWQIARRVTPMEDEIRPLVDHIQTQAGEDGLQPGEKISVPVSDNH